jgi:hypothetical protein
MKLIVFFSLFKKRRNQQHTPNTTKYGSHNTTTQGAHGMFFTKPGDSGKVFFIFLYAFKEFHRVAMHIVKVLQEKIDVVTTHKETVSNQERSLFTQPGVAPAQAGPLETTISSTTSQEAKSSTSAEAQASDKATGSGLFDNQKLKQEADARANAKCRGSVVLIRKINRVDYEAEAFK